MNRALTPASLWRDLRRRKVVGVVLAYGAVALILIEGANNILPVLGAPDSVNRMLVWLLLGGLPVAIVLAWKFDVVTDPGPSAGSTIQDDKDLPRDRIAVLPFEDLSEARSDEYFAVGVAEDIIAKLAHIPAFSVVSRTSVIGFRGTIETIAAIGRKLGAGSILEGSVRRSGGRVRVVARLINANTDCNLWSETFDRDVDDLFGVQSEIAASVARGLSSSLTAEDEARVSASQSGSAEAYDLYLKAKYLWNRRSVSGLRESRALLTEAISRDPDMALAHAGMASTLATAALYGLDSPFKIMPRALEASERALAIDPNLVEALNARGLIECIWQWDWTQGATTFSQAAAHSPSDAVAHQWYAMNCLAPQGRLVEAHKAMMVARSLDPLSKTVQASEGFLRYLDRDLTGAEKALAPALEGSDPLPVAHLFMGFVHQLAGRHEEASREFRRAESSGGRTVEALAALATNHALTGDRDGAQALLNELVSIAGERYVSPGRMAQVCAAMDDWEQAHSYWSEAIRGRSADLIWLGVSPVYDFARGRPEFRRAVEVVGAVDHRA